MECDGIIISQPHVIIQMSCEVMLMITLPNTSTDFPKFSKNEQNASIQVYYTNYQIFLVFQYHGHHLFEQVCLCHTYWTSQYY